MHATRVKESPPQNGTVADPELLAVAQEAKSGVDRTDIKGGDCERGPSIDTAAGAAGPKNRLCIVLTAPAHY